MAMQKCAECGCEVSSQATTCPKCGAPVKGKPFAWLIVGAIAFVVFLFAKMSQNAEDRRVQLTPEKISLMHDIMSRHGKDCQNIASEGSAKLVDGNAVLVFSCDGHDYNYDTVTGRIWR